MNIVKKQVLLMSSNLSLTDACDSSSRTSNCWHLMTIQPTVNAEHLSNRGQHLIKH